MRWFDLCTLLVCLCRFVWDALAYTRSPVSTILFNNIYFFIFLTRRSLLCILVGWVHRCNRHHCDWMKRIKTTKPTKMHHRKTKQKRMNNIYRGYATHIQRQATTSTTAAASGQQHLRLGSFFFRTLQKLIPFFISRLRY